MTWQHQRKVKNTQNYEFYPFQKNSRMQGGFQGTPSDGFFNEIPSQSLGTGILFEEPNPTGSRPRDLIGLYRRWQPRKRRPQPAKRSSRGGGGGDRGSTAARPTLLSFIQEGNRTPVAKATHSRYREGPVTCDQGNLPFTHGKGGGGFPFCLKGHLGRPPEGLVTWMYWI